MKKILLIILLFTPVLLISCQPEQSSQYLLTFRWPLDSIKKYESSFRHLGPGLYVQGSIGLLGMVSHVVYRKDSVDVILMIDKKIPIGSEIIYVPCLSGSISIEYSKQHKYYRPGDVIPGNVTLTNVCL